MCADWDVPLEDWDNQMSKKYSKNELKKGPTVTEALVRFNSKIL